MKLLPSLLLVVAASSLGCEKEGACVMPSGNDEICTLQKKGVCEQGKGHKYFGGECSTAGYSKKTGDGIWEKK
jgi:hypothetical protein